MEALETLGIDFKIIFVQIVGFLILYWVLNKFLFSRIKDMLTKRKEEIKAAYEKNESERQEIARLKEEYEKRIEGIKLEAEKATNEGRAIGEKKREEIILKANEEANQIIKKAKAESEQLIEQEREKAFEELREKMAELSIQIASKVLDKELSTTDDHMQLFEKYIPKIGDLYEK